MPIPLLVPLIASAVASIGSAVIGALQAAGKDAEAKRLLDQSRDEFGNIDLPKLDRIVAEQVPPSLLQQIKVDPRLQEAQYTALNKLQEISDQGGLTLADKAALNAQLSQAQQAERGSRAAILSQMAQRGTLGSGAELAAQLSNQQASATRGNQAALQTAAAAQQRAYDAIMGRGQMGGQMRSQQFGEEAQKASAQDLINRYNAAARGQANLYNAGLSQQEFDNQMRKAAGKAGMAQQAAGDMRQSGAQQAAMWGGLAQTAMATGTQLARGLEQGGGAQPSGTAASAGMVPRDTTPTPRTEYWGDAPSYGSKGGAWGDYTEPEYDEYGRRIS